MGYKTIHWFRKGLRLHDNPALLAALEGSDQFWPVFILDPHFVQRGNVGINRWRFLLQALRDLDENFKKLGIRLYVLKGQPKAVLEHVFKKWKVTRLTFEVDTEPYAKLRDSSICDLAKNHSVEVIKCVSHTLFDTDKVIKANGGKPPVTYQRLQNVLSKMAAPASPVPAPIKADMKACSLSISPDHDSHYGVPTLEDLGLDTSQLGPALYPGGETEGLNRMEKYLQKKSWICSFEKPKTEPNSLEPSTTVLSPYLKFGCLSARTFYYGIAEVYKGKNHSKPPVSLHGQLLWREFFYTCAAGIENFHKMEGNSICQQIPWDENKEFLEAWKNGRTGYPFIDAIMTQLRREGWIHHLARHAVACFLTRGDLWVSWEEGQKVFEELLLDADYSLNAGNWQWLSASAFFHQYFRVYSPIAFGKKTDKNGDFIKKYLPVLKKFPHQYIYEPWKAPREMQERAGCIIGVDYPKPIVDHDVVMKKNIQRMKEARANQPGNGSQSDNKVSKGAKRSLDELQSPPEGSPKKSKKKGVGKDQKNKITAYAKK